MEAELLIRFYMLFHIVILLLVIKLDELNLSSDLINIAEITLLYINMTLYYIFM